MRPQAKEDAPSEHNTIVLKLKVECRRRPDGTVENASVYSRQLQARGAATAAGQRGGGGRRVCASSCHVAHRWPVHAGLGICACCACTLPVLPAATAAALQWLPEGSEMPDETSCRFASSQTSVVPDVQPVHGDILIAKLRPGQAIELECHCIKGVWLSGAGLRGTRSSGAMPVTRACCAGRPPPPDLLRKSPASLLSVVAGLLSCPSLPPSCTPFLNPQASAMSMPSGRQLPRHGTA